jgi:hypothetical protein
MSLSYDFTRVKDYQSVCLDKDGKIKPLTHALIISTTSIGMSEITTKNAAQFYARIRVVERLYGPLLDGKRKLTPKHIHSHIRLKTNAEEKNVRLWAQDIITDKIREYATEYHQRDFEDPVEAPIEGKGVLNVD